MNTRSEVHVPVASESRRGHRVAAMLIALTAIVLIGVIWLSPPDPHAPFPSNLDLRPELTLVVGLFATCLLVFAFALVRWLNVNSLWKYIATYLVSALLAAGVVWLYNWMWPL